MPTPTPVPLDGSRLRPLYWALVGGLVVIMGAFGVLFWLKTAPLLRDARAPLIAWVMSGVAAAVLLAGLLWARPQVPTRSAGGKAEDLWSDPAAAGRALMLWVMWEGGTMIATVGTLLTGGYPTACVAVAGLALLLTHSPGYLESRG